MWLYQTPLKYASHSDAEVEGCVALLNAAADPVRWTLLQRLNDGQACVCDLQGIVAVAPNLLSYHLKVLREAGLVTCPGGAGGSTTSSPRTRCIDSAAALPLPPEVKS